MNITNKKSFKLTESKLNALIRKSIQKVLNESEEKEKREVFTISAFDIKNEEDVSDMAICGQTYYSFDDAVEAAKEIANTFIDYPEVILTTVFGGEYEYDNGDIYGDPIDLYCISNSDLLTTSIMRRKCGYVNNQVDEYLK